MAITAIDLFQDKGGSIVGRMLSGGTSVFGDAIQSLIGVGRDMANNQTRQERDFLQERRAVESLDQRRAENLQEQANTDRAFAENTFRDRRDTAVDLFQDERDYKRTVARDEQDLAAQLFSQGMRGAEFEQRKADDQLRRERFDLEKGEIDADRRFNEGLLTPPASPVYGPPTPEEMFAEAEVEADAAKELRNPEAYRAAIKKGAEAKAAAGTRGTSDGAAARRAEEGLEMRRRTEQRTLAKEQAAAAEEEAKKLLADGGAFKPQLESLPKDTKTDSPEYLAAYNFDKDRYAAESSAATSMSKSDYVNKGLASSGGKTDPGSLTDVQKKRRARFWELVNNGPQTPQGEGNAAADYVRGAANMK